MRRSITGRWKTIARAKGADCATPPQVTWPLDGAINPMAVRRKVVFPEPLGPISTVGAPAPITSYICRRICDPPAPTLTFENSMGKSEMAASLFIRQTVRR